MYVLGPRATWSHCAVQSVSCPYATPCLTAGERQQNQQRTSKQPSVTTNFHIDSQTTMTSTADSHQAHCPQLPPDDTTRLNQHSDPLPPSPPAPLTLSHLRVTPPGVFITRYCDALAMHQIRPPLLQVQPINNNTSLSLSFPLVACITNIGSALLSIQILVRDWTTYERN